MRRTNTRCEEIIALIDRCLADYELATVPAAGLTRRPLPRGGAR